MNPGLMVGLAFIGATLVVVYLQFADVRKARGVWASIPTLADYVAQHPDCKTDHGITCANCRSGSLKEKGLASEQDARRTFTCSHCEAVLYRSA
ncbi:MAG: hypothetical protein PHY45_09020 [Rhodocyclaceae bacterium]|nr:hypothetical protein [Rhodocyclaceae bacterium]